MHGRAVTEMNIRTRMCRKIRRTAPRPGIRRNTTGLLLGPVSYTHLDVYKRQFSILAVAEGAISREDAKMSKKELKEKKKRGVVYPSVAYEIGAKIQEVIGSEVRVTVPGHMQRGGEPCSYDPVSYTHLQSRVRGQLCGHAVAGEFRPEYD